MVGLEAPSIQADRDVIGEGVGAGKVEVDQARKLVTKEKHIVGEQVGVDHAFRQTARPVALMLSKFLVEEALKLPLHLVGARRAVVVKLTPAGDRKRIGAPQRKIQSREMQTRQRGAEPRTVGSRRPPDPQAFEKRDDRGRPARDGAEHVALAVLDWLRTSYATARQRPHH